MNINQILPYKVDCFAENIALVYDADTRRTSNVEGVETRVPGFGDTSVSVEWISKSRRGYSVYFANIVQKLLQQVNSKLKFLDILCFEILLFNSPTHLQGNSN